MAGASKAVADSRANLPSVYRQYSAEQLKQVLNDARESDKIAGARS